MHELNRDINPNTLRILQKFPRISYDKFVMDVARKESKRTRSHLRTTVTARLAQAGLDKSDLNIDADAVRYEAKVLGKIIDNSAQEYMDSLPKVMDIGGQKIHRPNKKYGSNTGIGFAPTREQREMVYDYVYSMARLEDISGCIINPETGSPITISTLKKAFQYEISRANVDRTNAFFKQAMAMVLSGEKSAPAMLRSLINTSKMGYDKKLDMDVEATKRKDDRERGNEDIVIDDADFALIEQAFKSLPSTDNE